MLWVVSEAAEERRFESQLSWLDIQARIIGFPALAVAGAIVGVLCLLGLVWLALALVVPFGVVSRFLGRVPTVVGLAGAALALAIAAFMVWRTWNSLGGYPAWVVRVVMIVIAVAVGLWFLASLVKPERAGASGIAGALVGIAALELFYISGLDGVPKLAVLLAAVALNYGIYRVVRRQLAVQREELRARAEPGSGRCSRSSASTPTTPSSASPTSSPVVRPSGCRSPGP